MTASTRVLLALITLFAPLSVNAQYRQGMAPASNGPQNVVKYNLLGTIAYRNIPLYFERAIYGPVAISAGFAYKIPTKSRWGIWYSYKEYC